MPESPMLLTIQGNIAAGKSLLYEALRKELEEKHSGEVCFVPEPVGLWKDIKGEDGKDMIEKYYGDQKKYAFAFQMMAYISRLSLLRRRLKADVVIVGERSLGTDRQIFAAMLHDEGKIEDVEYQIISSGLMSSRTTYGTQTSGRRRLSTSRLILRYAPAGLRSAAGRESQ